jgi:hypothetical protein
MWKYVYDSITGTSHAQSSQPCQDYCKGKVHEYGSSNVLIAACSDGAGSAMLSSFGAKESGERFFAEVELWLQNCVISGPPDHEIINSWVNAARISVLEKAIELNALPRELACTLIGAVVADNWAVFVQIGDGAIVFDCEDSYQVAFWPENGEYANTTYFLTDDHYEKHVMIDVLPQKKITELAVFTDGLQMLALDYVNSQPYTRFFTPLFATVRSSQDQELLQKDLLAYLSSERMNKRTDDDKSLLLATRVLKGTD